GTDTAFTVVIKDTLSQMLDASSFNLLANSHPVQVNRSNSNLSFTFNNILLPDSGTNLKGSHGYVKYKVKSTPGLPTNSSITNRAAIYFDFNAPVITNYAISSFPQARITTNLENEQESPIQVYPNPIQHGILKTYKSTIPNAKLYNSSGQLVFSGKIDEDGISLVHLPQGIYLLISETIRQKVILE
ncbi:MAG: T9SS type A sorting domain-containing protein, partial [Cytophagales bacterium]|nr:T9SS type A sorting domain-containing protein [Cytophagales bacterium]